MTGIKFKFTYTTNLIVVWYANSAPLAEVGRQVYNNTFSGVATVLTPALSNVAYTFKFFTSADGSTLQTLLDDWAVDATILYDKIVSKFQYVTDRGQAETNPAEPYWIDPVTGATEVTDARLNGVTQEYLDVFKGQRFLLNNEWQVKAGGGITLLNGESFQPDEPLFVTKYENVVSQNQNTGGVIATENINIVSGSGAFGVAYYSKENIADGGAGIMTTTFGIVSSIPDNTVASFSTYGGGQRYWVLKLSAGETVNFMGSARNAIYLAKNEKIKVFFTTVSSVKKCFVIEYSGRYESVGQRVWGDKLEINTIYRDGTEYNANDYPRLYEWIASLPAAQAVNYTTWASNKGLFAINAANPLDIKFKVPDDRDMFIRGLRTMDGVTNTDRVNNIPGGFQNDALDFTNVTTEIREGSGGSGTGPIQNKGFSGQDNLAAWVNGSANIKYSGAGITTTGTRPDNIGMIPLILI